MFYKLMLTKICLYKLLDNWMFFSGCRFDRQEVTECIVSWLSIYLHKSHALVLTWSCSVSVLVYFSLNKRQRWTIGNCFISCNDLWVHLGILNTLMRIEMRQNNSYIFAYSCNNPVNQSCGCRAMHKTRQIQERSFS